MHGPAAPTIRTYISGLRQLQIARGFPDPNVGSMPRLRQIFKGVAVIRGREGTARRPISRLPVTPKHSPMDEGDMVMQLQGGGPGPVNAVGSVLHDLLHI